jgi:hypothetical protein
VSVRGIVSDSQFALYTLLELVFVRGTVLVRITEYQPITAGTVITNPVNKVRMSFSCFFFILFFFFL